MTPARNTTSRSASGCSPATRWSRPRSAPAASMATRAGTRRSPRSRCRISSSGSMARTRVETRARARALQALYAWDMRGGDLASLERVATQVWDDLSISPEERTVAGPIVRAVARGQRELDLDLADVTTNWRLERIGAVERCVL